MTRLFALITLIIFSLTSCVNNEENKYEPKYSNKPIELNKTYVLGVHPLHNPKRLFEVYQPLVDYINKKIPSITLKLEASRNYATYNEKLFSQKFDFSLPNPYQTVKSLDYGYEVFGKMGNDELFSGVIIVRKDSKIKKVSDLKGKVVAYPAPTALAATMMPQYYLYENGIDIKKDITNNYVGSQESSIMNVYLEKSQASSTWPLAWNGFKKLKPKIAKELKIIWKTKPLVNNGLVVKKGTPEELTKNISNILFSLHKSSEGKKILEAMGIDYYEKADEKTFEVVINFLETFEKNVRLIKDDK